MVNANYIAEVLGMFMKIFRKKRPQMAAIDWLFHWDKALVHTAIKVTDWLAARDIRLIEHPPYSHIHWIWHQRTTSSSPGSRGSWQASP
jgi:hypothetical protein